MLRIYELKVKALGGEKAIPRKLLEKLPQRGRGLTLAHWSVVKSSVDARVKGSIKMVYTVDFVVVRQGSPSPKEDPELEKRIVERARGIRIERVEEGGYEPPVPGEKALKSRPVIVGFGPCGMFCALILAELGYRPIVVERGKPVSERVKDVEAFWEQGILNPESNVQFGEGGAGTFSDGKLTTRIKDVRVEKVIRELARCGGGDELLKQQRPHIGTDVLRQVVRNMRRRIEELGGDIRFGNKLTGVITREQQAGEGRERRIAAVMINDSIRLEAEVLILATGHSARDTLRMLADAGLIMEPKPFSMGVRIEHTQAMIDRAQYGAPRDELGMPPADYHLSYRCQNGRGVYTFCMCPGGTVIASASQEGTVVTNGMSLQARDGQNANSGLLVDVKPQDFASPDPLAGVAFQERYERLAFEAGGGGYLAPAMRVGDFLSSGGSHCDGRGETASMAIEETAQHVEPSYRPGVAFTDLSRCLPPFVSEALREALPELGRKLSGFDRPDAVMTGVETRSSSPVRLLRGEDLESRSVAGIYPGGEGAGYAGGIVSAAVDGIKIAEKIVGLYAPFGYTRR